jgi:hypothetical protein
VRHHGTGMKVSDRSSPRSTTATADRSSVNQRFLKIAPTRSKIRPETSKTPSKTGYSTTALRPFSEMIAA